MEVSFPMSIKVLNKDDAKISASRIVNPEQEYTSNERYFLFCKRNSSFALKEIQIKTRDKKFLTITTK